MIQLHNINTTKLKKNKLFQQKNLNDTMLAMSEYDRLAKCYLLKVCSTSVATMILSNPELLSYITECLMFGSCRWNKDRRGTHHGYLVQCVRWGVLCVLRGQNAIHEKSLFDDVYEGGTLRFYETIEDVRYDRSNTKQLLRDLINHSSLSKRQILCITKVYVDGYKVEDLAGELGISKSAIFSYIQQGIGRLRKCLN